MINDVRLAFSALQNQKPPDGDNLAVLPIGPTSGVFVGIDDQSHQHLLLKSDASTPPAATDVAALTVTTRNLVIAGAKVQVLDVACLLAAVAEVFDHFVVAIVERVAVADETANDAVESVLQRWRQFLVAPSGPPSREKLAAVLGELLVVADVVHASAAKGIEFWVGPFGSRHDVRRGGTAIEVKTTRSHSTHRVTIHGEDQLLPPEGGVLYLHLVRLEEAHGSGRSVNSLVDELLGAGVSADKLFEALTAAGLKVADLTMTAQTTFDVRERLTLPIDEQTPRIVPASFQGEKRPAGVIDLSYVIDLGGQLHRALPTTAYENLVRSIGSGNTA